MAKYGNIMTVVNLDTPTQTTVEQLLSSHQVSFILFNGLYYLETNSKLNTTEVIKALRNEGVSFVFFHNHNSDNSEIKSNNIEPTIVDEIKRILLE